MRRVSLSSAVLPFLFRALHARLLLLLSFSILRNLQAEEQQLLVSEPLVAFRLCNGIQPWFQSGRGLSRLRLQIPWATGPWGVRSRVALCCEADHSLFSRSTVQTQADTEDNNFVPRIGSPSYNTSYFPSASIIFWIC